MAVYTLEEKVRNYGTILIAGRFQPPTIAHKALYERLKKFTGKEVMFVPMFFVDTNGKELLHKGMPFTSEETGYTLQLAKIPYHILSIKPPYFKNSIDSIKELVKIYNGVLYYRVANKGLLKRFLYSILGLPTIREERPKDEVSAAQFGECYFNL